VGLNASAGCLVQPVAALAWGAAGCVAEVCFVTGSFEVLSCWIGTTDDQNLLGVICVCRSGMTARGQPAAWPVSGLDLTGLTGLVGVVFVLELFFLVLFLCAIERRRWFFLHCSVFRVPNYFWADCQLSSCSK